MARQRVVDPRLTFRRGVLRDVEPALTPVDCLLTAAELRRGVSGLVEKRTGSVLWATLPAGALLAGIYQWFDSGGTGKIAALANGRLYAATDQQPHFWIDLGALVPGGGSNPGVAGPAPAASTVRLFVSNKTILVETNGSTMSTVATGAASGFIDLEVYLERLWGITGDTLHGSKILDGTLWGLANGGVNAVVAPSSDLVGIRAWGNSLLIFRQSSIARLAGTDPRTMRIDSQTLGVSDQIGCVHRNSICRTPVGVFFVASFGPALATESGVRPLAPELRSLWATISQLVPESIRVAYHGARQEVWFSFPALPGGFMVTWVWHLPTDSWWGPWGAPIAGGTDQMTAFRGKEALDVFDWRYESILTSRNLNLYYQDDPRTTRFTDQQVAPNSGGTAYSTDLETHPAVFRGSPVALKRLRRILVQADYPVGMAAMTASWASELGSGTIGTIAGAGSKGYRLRSKGRGRELRFRLHQTTVDTLSQSYRGITFGGQVGRGL